MALKPLSVSQINSYIKKILQGDPLLRNIRVSGEVSRVTYHRNGHVYFALKDEFSRINCVIFNRYVERLKSELKEGTEVTVTGYINLFEQGGTYSINVTDVEGDEQGALSIAFEKLKEKLAAEGLFDPAHKKPIPRFAKKVAVVTSDTGAALQDILKIIRSKNDITSVVISPCLVQGQEAPESIAAAIKKVNLLAPDCDAMIVGRGGGAAEELLAFNSEAVARAIYASKIPVISAVGHEIDFTIADLVADARAETPTAAANMAVFDSFALRDELKDLREGLGSNLRALAEQRERLLLAYRPDAMKNALKEKALISEKDARNQLLRMKEGLAALVAKNEKALEKELGILDSLSPTKTLLRGYSMVTDEKGSVVSSVEKLSAGDIVEIAFSDGKAGAEVKETEKIA